MGRQIWEFEHHSGTAEEKAEVEAARQNFYDNHFQIKPCADLLWCMQFMRREEFQTKIAKVKIEDGEEITYEKAGYLHA